MLAALKEEMNKTYTENGAVTYLASGNDCLDLFATIGALRSAGAGEVCTRFFRAFAEDRTTALRIAFFARDVRGGLGERRVFREIIRGLAVRAGDVLRKNIRRIPEYGRWDDLLVLLGTPCEDVVIELIRAQLAADEAALSEEGKPVSLLAKWMPSVNASNEETVRRGKYLARELGMKEEDYRKLLVRLRRRIRILENHLREKDYTFDYEKQPSRALFKYRAAFLRNDGERYGEFIRKASEGKAVLHTGTLYPYDLFEKVWKEMLQGREIGAEERAVLDATWKALPDYTAGENALAVVDGSGSMYGGGTPSPISVANSLGLYFAERNRGAFHNYFITFSMTPQLVEVKGSDFYERACYCMSFDECANTNVEAVFRLVLDAAVKHHVPQEELPKTLYFISDMEFDACAEDAGLTNFENAKRMFREAGYELPHVVFWNVASRTRQQPVTMHETGTALVSGASPILFQRVIAGETDPMAYMKEILESERYRVIEA